MSDPTPTPTPAPVSGIYALPIVKVSPRGAQRVEGGHPWIYRSDIVDTGTATGGDGVRVVDPRGVPLGVAFYSGPSQIALRMLSRQTVDPERLWRGRVAHALDLRRRLHPDRDAYRLVHSEGDFLPGLIVDRYGDALVLQILTEAWERRREALVEFLADSTGLRTVVERSDVPSRRHEGLESRTGILRGSVDGPVAYHEGRIALRADLLQGQKTGSFLDQTDNHILAGQWAHGRALDTFSYQGGFGLQMAASCDHVTALDISESAASQIRDNARTNGVDNLEVRAANAFDALRAWSDAGERFDSIVLDPPAFTKNRDAVDSALRGYKEINLRALRMLAPGGLLVTASCSFHVDPVTFEDMVRSAARDAGRDVQILARRGAGPDHPVALGAPETNYLKCLFLRVV